MTANELREKVLIAMERAEVDWINSNPEASMAVLDEYKAKAAIKLCMEAAAEFPQTAKEIVMERPQGHQSKKNFCITMDNLSKAILTLIPEEQQ